VQLITGVFTVIWISPSAGSGSSGSSSVFSGLFIAEEVDGVGDEGSRDTTTVHVQSVHVKAFLNMSMRSAYFILMKLFFW
jgi:hypothetical protein